MTWSNRFHDHLDVCKQCRDQPFNLCQTGALELKKTAQEIADKNSIFKKEKS